MTANILDGKLVANLRQTEIKQQVAQRLEQGLPLPGLAVIIVGTDPASTVYVKRKQQACQQVGFYSELHQLATTITEMDLLKLIEQLNQRTDIHGILLQLPLPAHCDKNVLLSAIDPNKDVDGFHPYNMGRLAQQYPVLRPCTPYGIIQLLQHYQIPLKGKHAVIIGASNIVGRPMALELLLLGATVTVCHRFTTDLSVHVAQADILIVAIGKRDIINTAWLKPQVVVIDVGIHRLANGTLVGDVDFAAAKQQASWLTPVPGGVGPMTIASLLQNTLTASKLFEHQ